jgi:undecaprenyl diphosphate synthase
VPKIAKAHNSLEKRKNADPSQSEPVALKHVAIIMDGNRRWADKHALPRLFGHKEGVKSLKRLVKHVTARKLEYLTVYAFSSENWQRGHEEVDYLMQLFNEVLKTELDELARAGARLRFIGDLEHMPAELQKGLSSAEQKTRDNSGLNLQVALNYGSRLEITTAVKHLVADVQSGAVAESDITPELLGKYLYTADIPDPDLMIRTGGEMRLSNYLLWQSAYTELYVTPIMWPEFQPKHFDEAVASFQLRQRRYGGD